MSCSCGSGGSGEDDVWWENDARGIPLAKVCKFCKDKKLSIFRPEVLNDPDYYADEPIEDY